MLRKFSRFVILCLCLFGIGAGSAAAGAVQAGLDAFQAERWGDSMKLLLPAAESGSAEAQYRVGKMFDQGLGVEKNHCDAVLWFDKAARQGHPQSQREMAWAYSMHRGVFEDELEAYLWYLASVDNGVGMDEMFSAQLSSQELLSAQEIYKHWSPVNQAPVEVHRIVFIPIIGTLLEVVLRISPCEG